MGGVRVAVIGGSIAGCLTAAALAACGQDVLVLERDELADSPEPRRGVPQGGQPHVFLARGLREAETLLPGLMARLRTAGAVPLDTGRLPWLTEWGWLPPGPSIEVLSLTRPLLERELRAMAVALPRVRLRDQAQVRAVRRDGAMWAVGLQDGTEEMADVVIDATGRSSRLTSWLQRAGLPAATEGGVDAQLGYASRVYAGDLPGAAGVVVQLNTSSLRGGLALPVENGRWLIAAMGCGPARPPRDEAGHFAALQSLPDPALAELAAALEPCSDVSVHRRTDNHRRRWDRLRELPPGLLVVGDALCSFNPAYGQGVTVAALQAVVLREHADELTAGRPMHRLQRRVAACTRLPWMVAAGGDARFPTSTGAPGTLDRLVDGWGRRLSRAAAAGDATALDALSHAYHLLAAPTALARPRVLLAGVGAGRGGRPVPRPTLLG